MIKFLHTGDLHLKAPPSEDSGNSLACLEILILKANAEAVDAVLLCGDIFDKEKDYADNDFRQKAVAIFNRATMPLYYIPGNHEDHRGEFSKLRTIDWGKRVKLLADVSLETFTQGDQSIEILAVPHSTSYEDFTAWNISKKSTRHRIAIAHGEIPGFTFLGDEEDASVLNPSLFVHHEVSHVFMGHIHLAASQTSANVAFYYAGSPRPVRRREVGVRGYNIIEVDDSISVERKVLVETGLVHNIRATVLGDNWVQETIAACQHYDENDRIHIVLEGMVEDMDQAQQGIDALTKNLQKKFRRVDIKIQLEPLEDLIQNPFYKQVYDVWLKKKPTDAGSRDFQVWLQMLNSLKFMREEVLK